MSDKQLEQLAAEYADLAKNDKNVDAAALMINALQQQDQNKLSPKAKKWAYLLSLGVPPLGFAFAIYYFTKSETDAKSAAIICAVLTTISLAFSIIFFQTVLHSTGVSVEQIQQINPQDIYQLTQ